MKSKDDIIQYLKSILCEDEIKSIQVYSIFNNIIYSYIKNSKNVIISAQCKKNRAQQLITQIFNEYNISNENIVFEKYFSSVIINDGIKIVFTYIKESHKIIPRFILNKFQIDSLQNNKMIYVYNLKEKKSHKAFTKSYNVQTGYYSDYIEDFLAKYESKVGEIVSYVEKYINDDKKIQELLKQVDSKILREFFGIEMMRNQKNISLVNENSQFNKIYADLSPNDLMLIFSKGGIPYFFKDFTVYLITNTSNIPFILNNTLISDINQEVESLFMPLSPHVAIMISKGIYNNIITDSSIANKINKHIFYQAYLDNGELIGDEETILALISNELMIENVEELKA